MLKFIPDVDSLYKHHFHVEDFEGNLYEVIMEEDLRKWWLGAHGEEHAAFYHFIPNTEKLGEQLIRDGLTFVDGGGVEQSVAVKRVYFDHKSEMGPVGKEYTETQLTDIVMGWFGFDPVVHKVRPQIIEQHKDFHSEYCEVKPL